MACCGVNSCETGFSSQPEMLLRKAISYHMLGQQRLDETDVHSPVPVTGRVLLRILFSEKLRVNEEQCIMNASKIVLAP